MRLRLFDIDNWHEIMVTLSHNKTRTFMTGFGIFWGTAILALCFGAGRGFQGMMSRQFQGFATNTGAVIPQPTTEGYGGFNSGRYWSLTDNDIDQIRKNVEGIDLLTSVSKIQANLKFSTNSSSASGMGIEPDYWNIQQYKLLEGRYINESDIAGQKKVVDLGEQLAAKLFGDIDPLGQEVNIDGVYYTVVGVVGQLSQASIGGDVNNAVVFPWTTMRAAYNLVSPHFIAFTSAANTTPTEVASQMKSILKRNHQISPTDDGAFYIMDVSEMFNMVQKVFLGVDLLALFVGLGTLIAGVIGVGNIMWIIVKERTNEFGIRRAIGATPADLTIQIISESIVLTTISGLGGVTLGALILGVVDHHFYDPWLGKPGFEISFSAAMTILVLFLVLGTAAGIIPALKAMKVKPVEAINAK